MPQVLVRQHKPRAKPGDLSDRPSWEEAVEAFLEAKKGKNVTPATLENYRWHLLGPRARAFVADRGIESPVDVRAESNSTRSGFSSRASFVASDPVVAKITKTSGRSRIARAIILRFFGSSSRARIRKISLT